MHVHASLSQVRVETRVHILNEPVERPHIMRLDIVQQARRPGGALTVVLKFLRTVLAAAYATGAAPVVYHRLGSPLHSLQREDKPALSLPGPLLGPGPRPRLTRLRF
eukprot:7385072-Prymnesium_polylepis.2